MDYIGALQGAMHIGLTIIKNELDQPTPVCMDPCDDLNYESDGEGRTRSKSERSGGRLKAAERAARPARGPT